MTQYRELGYTGEKLSTVGFGAWAIGGAWTYGWGEVEDQRSIETIRRGLEVGINWIDTAPAYGLGHSEEIIAKALDGRRDEVFLATKCGLVWDDAGNVSRSLHPESLRRELEASLRRLKTDVIDLYQIHWPDHDGVPIEETWGALAEFVKAGKVRYLGVSNFNVELMQRCQPIHPIASLQPIYNMLRRGIEDEVMAYCAENDIGIVAYSPMMSGLLTDKFDYDSLAEDDWRRRDFGDTLLRSGDHLVKALKPIAQAHDATVAQVAVAWVLRRREISSAIVGARKVWQVEQNAAAMSLALSEDELQKIDALSAPLADMELPT